MNSNQTLTMNGSLNLASGSTLTLDASPFNSVTQMVVGGTGTLTCSNASLARNGSYSAQVSVNAGGRLVTANTSFGTVRLLLNAGNTSNVAVSSKAGTQQGPVRRLARLVKRSIARPATRGQVAP